MNAVANILKKQHLSKKDIIRLLSISEEAEMDYLRKKSAETTLQFVGKEIYLRGLIEFSNICHCDCYYCGIRKSNTHIKRYILEKDDIVKIAGECADLGFASIVLQSGESKNQSFIDFVAECVREIKKTTRSGKLPYGLGITLCCGEQKYETYEKWYEAGAHRYLLRVESSDKDFFSQLHPQSQSFENRIECLKALKKIGYQTGSGVLIGVPGQKIDHLAGDIEFFKGMDIDMVGMGPYIPHHNTPFYDKLEDWQERIQEVYSLSLKMIAVTRLAFKDVNIAATTALGSINDRGREQGLRYGANVIMPLMTPVCERKNYTLYENKPVVDKIAKDINQFSEKMKITYDRIVKLEEWGDAPHFFK